MATATLRDIVTRLNREIGAILAGPDLKARFNNDGAEVIGGTPEAFGTHIANELQRWAKVIKDAGIKPQ